LITVSINEWDNVHNTGLTSLRQFHSAIGDFKSPFSDEELAFVTGLDAKAPVAVALQLAEKSLTEVGQTITKFRVLIEKLLELSNQARESMNNDKSSSSRADGILITRSDLVCIVETALKMYVQELSVKQRIYQDLNHKMDLKTLATYLLVWEAQPSIDKNARADIIRRWKVHKHALSEKL